MTRLSQTQISRSLASIPGWAKRAGTIHRTFVFKGFLDAVDFVNRVAAKAERADHHPDITVRWNKVTLALTTHSEGGLTRKDFSMARQCGETFTRHFGRR